MKGADQRRPNRQLLDSELKRVPGTMKGSRIDERREKTSASQAIGARAEDWRRETLARVRSLIGEADPEITEEVKWRKPSNPSGVPVWERDGIVCTGETYKDKVKLTFAKGALLEDPSGLFNSGLDGNIRRAIDLHEGDEIDEEALRRLIRAAVTLNRSRKKSKRA